MKWPQSELDTIINSALAHGDQVAEVTDASAESAESLRYALYRRLRERDVKSIRISLQGAKLLLLYDPAPRVLMTQAKERA